MANRDELINILECILSGKRDEEDIAKLRQSLSMAGSVLQLVSQDGKFNTNIGQITGGEVHLGDRIYQGTDAETIRQFFREVLEASSIAPTAPFHIYIVSQNEEGLRLESYYFPYNDITKNSDYARFLALLNQLPNLKIQPEMCLVFRITDEVTLDSTNATDNANTGVIVIPQAVLE
jgi:hypothetical protein